MIEEEDDGKGWHIFQVTFGTSQLRHGLQYWLLQNLSSNGSKPHDLFGIDWRNRWNLIGCVDEIYLLTCRGMRTFINAVRRRPRRTNENMNILTVNPRGIFPPLPRYKLRGSVRLLSMKIFKHSAQKSNNFWPSPCFCSSVRRYFDCVISNFPSPWIVTKHTRRLVPPEY